ncbi:MAG: 50S ribosomal protein L19e [Euryarchaeota archaeon]|nr:50S ribosomal protein L19e [Euryarchaeota archaeon]
MDLKTQRRLAAAILKVGTGRVYFHPDALEDIDEAVTREDVRRLIADGAIAPRPIKGTSRHRARKRALQRKKGRQRGHGTRSGTKYARASRKRRWINTIRPLRASLREMRDSGGLDAGAYRRYYRMAKSGMFKDKAHMESYIKEKGVE